MTAAGLPPSAGNRRISSTIKKFLANNGLHKVVAFSGGADEELYGVDDAALKESYRKVMQWQQQHVIEQVVSQLSGFRIAVLTGGTAWGLPRTAANLAHSYGLKTIGLYPLAAHDKALAELDLALEVEPIWGESRWGDESPLFASLLDGVVVYGGGAGTLVEMAHILKINEKLLKDGSPLKYIVPISGTGGVADGLPFVWAKPEVRRQCMPEERIVSGSDAGKILIDKLDLFSYSTLDDSEKELA